MFGEKLLEIPRQSRGGTQLPWVQRPAIQIEEVDGNRHAFKYILLMQRCDAAPSCTCRFEFQMVHGLHVNARSISNVVALHLRLVFL